MQETARTSAGSTLAKRKHGDSQYLHKEVSRVMLSCQGTFVFPRALAVPMTRV
jgi:hypothetical protein